MNNKKQNTDMTSLSTVTRREFVRGAGACTLAGSSLILGVACFERSRQPASRMETSIADMKKIEVARIES